MLNEQEKTELAELTEKYLDSYGKPRMDVTVDAEVLMRISELQELDESPDEPKEPTVEELKEQAKEAGIRGYANMKRETLVERIEQFKRLEGKDSEPEKEPEGNSIFIKSMEAKGYEYLGENSRGQYFYGPDKKAYVSGNSGMRSVGNTFGDKLLKSLTK